MNLSTLIGNNVLISQASNLNADHAIELMCTKLLATQAITPNYVEAIKASHHKLGAYYVVAPKIAMPHARPEDGVVRDSLQLTVFKNGLDLGDEDNGDVYLAITLAATGAENHLQLIQCIANFFQNEELIEQVIQCKTVAEIQTLLQNLSN